MVYALQSGCIYGPVASRRLGRSLGLNILPTEMKICPFDCVYCHYGVTDDIAMDGINRPGLFPTMPEIVMTLGAALQRIRTRDDGLDFITFSGNGEPSIHPYFPRIVDEVIRLRDQRMPDVPVAILSNSTTVSQPRIRDALMKLDRRIMKLDAGDEETFRAVNHPHDSVTLDSVIDGLAKLDAITIQAAFMTGSVDNINASSVDAWISAVDRIGPDDVQIYTVDRPSADGLLERAERSVLEKIARDVIDRTGISAAVY